MAMIERKKKRSTEQRHFFVIIPCYFVFVHARVQREKKKSPFRNKHTL